MKFLALRSREVKDLPPAIDWKASDSLGTIKETAAEERKLYEHEHEILVVNNSGNPPYTAPFELFSILHVQAASLVDNMIRGVVLFKNEYSTGIMDPLLSFDLIFRRSG